MKNHHSGKVYEKQDCVVGDSTTCGCVVLWEGDLGHFKEGNTWVGATVQDFRGVNILTVGGECKTEPVEDIGEVVEVEEGDLQKRVG